MQKNRVYIKKKKGLIGISIIFTNFCQGFISAFKLLFTNFYLIYYKNNPKNPAQYLDLISIYINNSYYFLNLIILLIIAINYFK